MDHYDTKMVVLQLCRFKIAHKNSVADVIRLTLTFIQKSEKNLLFEPPFLDLGLTYAPI